MWIGLAQRIEPFANAFNRERNGLLAVHRGFDFRENGERP